MDPTSLEEVLVFSLVGDYQGVPSPHPPIGAGIEGFCRHSGQIPHNPTRTEVLRLVALNPKGATNLKATCWQLGGRHRRATLA